MFPKTDPELDEDLCPRYLFFLISQIPLLGIEFDLFKTAVSLLHKGLL